jgi:phosphatidylinositol-3-phosphatase
MSFTPQANGEHGPFVSLQEVENVKYIVLTAILIVLAVACAPVAPSIAIPAAAPSITPTAGPTPTTTVAPGGVPSFSHIYLLMMENKEDTAIVGNSSAPYINQLISQYGLATNYTAVAHPSQPNYLALFSGSTQGVTDDDLHDVVAVSLADEVDLTGKSWRIFAQNVPPNCYTSLSALGGEDGEGTYNRKHNPAISFLSITKTPERCSNIADFTHFDPAAANFEFISPNSCNDMHSCSVQVGDDFLSNFVPRILNSDAWRQDGVLFITWDEGKTKIGGGGMVPLIVISSRVQSGFQSSLPHTHYSLLRTIQDAWGLKCLENSCSANNLTEFFTHQ